MAADAVFIVKLDGRTFTLPRVSLGDWYMFKTEFDLTNSDIVTSYKNEQGETTQVLNIEDPRVLVALIVAALQHERPGEPVSKLIEEVKDLGLDDLEFPSLQGDEPEADPTKEGADGNEATANRSKGSSSGKRQKKPGTQS